MTDPGTRSDRRRRGGRPGFTLIEAIVIIVILGVVAAVIAPRLINRVGQSKRAVAESNASSLATQMNLFIADVGAPPSGETILVLWEEPAYAEDGAWQGPYVQNEEQLNDPWGNRFMLVIPGEKNVDFDVVSYGADGRPGGEGEDADVTKP